MKTRKALWAWCLPLVVHCGAEPTRGSVEPGASGAGSLEPPPMAVPGTPSVAMAGAASAGTSPAGAPEANGSGSGVAPTQPVAGSTGAAPAAAPDDALLGTGTRPLLPDAWAAKTTVLQYLAQAGSLTSGLTIDGWDPTPGLGDVQGFTPDFRVGPGQPYTSVQAAISAAVAAGGKVRHYIEVAPGTYRELVCVPSGAPPITLYGSNPDASQTLIVFDNYSGKPKAAGTSANPCSPNTNGTSYGTSGSTTFAVYANDFQAKNLSFVNDTDESAASSDSVQAVALTAQGDKLVFENVRALGNQDTLFVKTGDVASVARSYFKDCYVEGDTDFIFGRGTAVFDGCVIHSVTSRTANGIVIAPSTDSRNSFGILVQASTFTADASAGASSTYLGRAWDESQSDVATYAANVATGIYPNGQALVRGSTLGAHIQSATPWRAAATTTRAFSAVAGMYPANRLYEYQNTGPGSAAE